VSFLLLVTYRRAPHALGRTIRGHASRPKALPSRRAASMQPVAQVMPLPEWRHRLLSPKLKPFPEELTQTTLNRRRARHPAYRDHQAVLAARIDRLPSETKRLLQTAAIIGYDVPVALLRRSWTVPRPSLSTPCTQHAGASMRSRPSRVGVHL
jgi:hypothetical protein